jgi:hypothetical protein
MKLPNADRAVVDIAKVRDYCLNPLHKDGKFKAQVFRAALGITRSDWALLRSWLLDAANNSDATRGVTNQFGHRFIIDFTVAHNNRSAQIRSAWIIRTAEDFPRLTTCYVI